LHDLCHTHATLLLKAGVHVKVVTQRLGHANVAFTMNVYQHVLPGMQAEAAETFASSLGVAEEGPVSLRASSTVNLGRHSQHGAREGACRKRPKRADHDSSAEPIRTSTYGARSCGMRVLPSADGSSGSAEPVEELAGRVRATRAGARSLCARWLSLSGATFAGERR
jgi:hypothetical protein